MENDDFDPACVTISFGDYIYHYFDHLGMRVSSKINREGVVFENFMNHAKDRGWLAVARDLKNVL